MASKQLDKGHGEGLTPELAADEEPWSDHKVRVASELEAMIAALGQSTPDLFEPVDRLEVAAETGNAKRRGRPLGAGNRRNDQLFDLLEARGFKMPEMRLMEIIAADPADLGTMDRKDALALQIRASEALLPYRLAKKPVSLEVRKTDLHFFVAGKLSEALAAKAELFNDFNGDAMREAEKVSHGTDEGEQDQEVKPLKTAD